MRFGPHRGPNASVNEVRPRLAPLPPVREDGRDARVSSVETVSVLFTDLVGSTGLASRIGPAAAEELRREHFSLLRDAIEATNGREVKNVGDGLMVVFPSAAGAVDCAVGMQQRIEQRNRRAEDQLGVRIGISLGDADCEDDDYFGPPVVEASRLCNAAGGGQILTIALVEMMVGSRTEHSFTAQGPLELKGIPEPVSAVERRVGSVRRRGQPDPAARAPPSDAAGRVRGPGRGARKARGDVGRGAERAPSGWRSSRASPGSGRRASPPTSRSRRTAPAPPSSTASRARTSACPTSPGSRRSATTSRPVPSRCSRSTCSARAASSVGWRPSSRSESRRCPRRARPIPRPSATSSTARSRTSWVERPPTSRAS